MSIGGIHNEDYASDFGDSKHLAINYHGWLNELEKANLHLGVSTAAKRAARLAPNEIVQNDALQFIGLSFKGGGHSDELPLVNANLLLCPTIELHASPALPINYSLAQAYAPASLNSDTVFPSQSIQTIGLPKDEFKAQLLETSLADLPAGLLEMIEWLPEVAHLMLTPNGVRIWLRNTAFSEKEGVTLLKTIRQQMGSTRLKVELTLNGKRIIE